VSESDYTRREFGRAVSAFAAMRASGSSAVSRERIATTLSALEVQPPTGPRGSLTDVPGLSVGHATDARRPTGCTVILFESPAAAGVDYNGSAPGESQVVMLQPVSPVDRIHALFLTGGGVLAIPAFDGVLRFLEERKVGYDWGTPEVRIPIVVSAVIDDLAVGDARIRPDAALAYKACANASTAAVIEGSVGAGAGATVGKMHRARGMNGMKGGLGSASLKLGDVVIGALAVVNAAGDVLDWQTGRIVAGAQRADGSFADSVDVMRSVLLQPRGPALDDAALHSTTLGVVATNVDVVKTGLTKIAMMANCGAARAVRPYHTTGDGDQLFAISTSRVQRPDLSLTVLGALAAEVMAEAIVRGVREATGVEGWPAVRDR
jgi:L-aminopeptidase/D-esterase-like protein